MYKILELQHHRHTGKVLHHRHTSFRGLALLLVVVGLSMGAIQGAARAISYDVSATVPAPLPTTQPTINTPTTGTIETQPLITVTGNCEIMTPQILVVIYSNNVSRGSTVCQGDGTFSVDITLLSGVNNLTAKPVNITGQSGPESAPAVQVTYNPPAPAPAPAPVTPTPVTPTPSAPQPVTQSAPAPTTSAPALKSNDEYFIYAPGQVFRWSLFISEGTTPYSLRVDWGDDTVTEQVIQVKGEVVLEHTYTRPAVYNITAVITDANQQTTRINLAAISPAIQNAPALAITPNIGSNGGGPISLGNILEKNTVTAFATTIITAYSIVLVGVLILWMHAHITFGAVAVRHVAPPAARSKRVVRHTHHNTHARHFHS